MEWWKMEYWKGVRMENPENPEIPKIPIQTKMEHPDLTAFF